MQCCFGDTRWQEARDGDSHEEEEAAVGGADYCNGAPTHACTVNTHILQTHTDVGTQLHTDRGACTQTLSPV